MPSARWRLRRTARRDLRGERAQFGQRLHADVAEPRDQPVQHVDRRPRIGQRAVVRRRRRAEEPGERGSLQLGTSSRVSTRRASTAVSTTANAGQARCCSARAAFRNPTSNGALCATSTLPCGELEERRQRRGDRRRGRRPSNR